MKKPSMTQGTKAHSSAIKMKAEQNAAMKMKKEAAMKMAANQQPMQAPAQPVAAPQQPAQQPMQQPAPTMMKKESPTKTKKMTGKSTAGKAYRPSSKKSAKEKLAKEGSAKSLGLETRLKLNKNFDYLNEKGQKKKLKSAMKLKSADEKTRRARVEAYAEGKKHIGTKRTPDKLRELAARAEKEGSADAAKKMRAKAGRAEAEKGRAADYLKKKSPAAMKKAPLKKPLVGKQKNLPEEIKKKILAAPTRHIKGTTQHHMMQHKFDGDHQDFKRGKKSPATKKGDFLSKAKDRVTNIKDAIVAGSKAKSTRRGNNVISTVSDAYLKSKRKTDKKYKKKK